MQSKSSNYLWITGASRGIGLASVREFLKNDWNVVVLTRNLDPLKPIQKQYPNALHLVSFDLLDFSQQVLPSFPVDVLINNAGALINKPMKDITNDDLQRIYGINVFGPFQLINKLQSQFRSDTHVLNISSVGGVQGSVKFPGLTAYSSSKGALSILTECLQAEFQDSDSHLTVLPLVLYRQKCFKRPFQAMMRPSRQRI